MFNGIITHLGKLETMKKNCYFFSTEKSFLKKIKKGASVAIDGICLTVIAKEKNTFSVEVMPETLRRTMLVELKIGDYVNLEHSVSANTPLDGHLVYGHIDGTAEISSIKKEDNSWIFKFKVPEKISKYLIEKGAIAVNGISLTIIEPKKDFFTVGIIPHTWKNTMLKYSKIGDKVNIELDVIAKYVEKQLTTKQLTTITNENCYY